MKIHLSVPSDRTKTISAIVVIVAAAVIAAPTPARAAETTKTADLYEGIGMGDQPSKRVRTVQRALVDRGYSVGAPGIDGRFGPLTAGAVRRLQADSRLVVDGIVGPRTRRVLGLPTRTRARKHPSSPARRTRERRAQPKPRQVPTNPPKAATPAPSRTTQNPPALTSAPRRTVESKPSDGLPFALIAGAVVGALIAAVWALASAIVRRRERRAPMARVRDRARRGRPEGAPESANKPRTPAPVPATDESRTEVPAAVTEESSTEVPAAVTEESSTEVPAAVTEESSTEVPAAVTEESSTEVPAAAAEESSTEVPAAAAEESSTEVPAAAAEESSTEVPAAAAEESSTEVPAAAAEESSTEVPARAADEPDSEPLRAARADEPRRGQASPRFRASGAAEADDATHHRDRADATDRPMIGYITVRRSVSGDKLHSQARAIDQACESAGWRLLEIVRDADTGRTFERPGLKYALERIADGDAVGLIVSDLRLLSHSVVDLGALLAWFWDAGAALIALDLGVDTSTREGHHAASAIITMSEWERERTAQRGRLRVAEAQPRDRDPDTSWIADRPEIVERIVELKRNHMTLRAIAAQLNREQIPAVRGGTEWRPYSVQAVLNYHRGRSWPREHLPALENRRRR